LAHNVIKPGRLAGGGNDSGLDDLVGADLTQLWRNGEGLAAETVKIGDIAGDGELGEHVQQLSLLSRGDGVEMARAKGVAQQQFQVEGSLHHRCHHLHAVGEGARTPHAHHDQQGRIQRLDRVSGRCLGPCCDRRQNCSSQQSAA
jgi:hypothetical protein